ncbi:hypothetical protein D3C73_971330 [compost metagenome]
MDRADEDDFSGGFAGGRRSPIQEHPGRRAGAQELAGQVGVDHLLPLRQRHVLDGGGLFDTGVVDQDVHRLKVIRRHAEQVFDVVLAADVGRGRDGLAARADDLLHHLGPAPRGVLIGPVVDHHLRPRRRQHQGNATPNAGIRARDNRHAPRQIHCMPHVALHCRRPAASLVPERHAFQPTCAQLGGWR